MVQTRHQDSTGHKNQGTELLDNQGRQVRGSIFSGIYGTTEETLASPLNFHINSTATYCSAHARYAIFGTRLNGYGNYKVGKSVYANPEYEQKELLKALK